MRLRQVHGAAPFARDHVRCIFGLLLFAAFDQYRRYRAMGQAGVHGKRHVGTGHIFFERHRHDVRHALTAKFGRSRQCPPSSRAILCIGVLEPIGGRHAAIFVPRAALQVTHLIERKQYALDELRAFTQDRFDHVGTGIFKTGQIGEAFDSQDFVDNKLGVTDWGLIMWHDMSFEG